MPDLFGRLAPRFSSSTTKMTAIGIAVAAFIAAALWFGLPHLHSLRTPDRVASDVVAGFVGEKQFGAWILNCPAPAGPASGALPAFSLMPGQGSPLPAPPGSTSTDENTLGRCRVMLRYFGKANSRHVVMILSFRTIRKQRALALILRFPPLVKKGDLIVVRAGTSGIRLPVQQCDADICLAAGELGPRGESLLLANKDGMLVFPPGGDGKKRAVRIPLAETARALAAMLQAESGLS